MTGNLDAEHHASNLLQIGKQLDNGARLEPASAWSFLNSFAIVNGLDAAVRKAEYFLAGESENPYHYYHLALLRACTDQESARCWMLSIAKQRARSPLFLYATGLYLSDSGDYPLAMDYLERSARQSRDVPDLINQFVFASMFAEGLDQVEYLRRLREMVNFHFSKVPLSVMHRPRKPRYVIGFVTASFNNHALIHFFEPLIRCLDRKIFMLLVFSSEQKEGVYYSHLESMVDVLYDVRSMSNPALLELIRGERVDVLVDLDHHTRGNRLWVFAQRAAPIQVTLYGLQTTTGLSAMDFRITDSRIDPDGAEIAYSESLLRADRAHFTHSLLAPPVSPVPSPCIRNGYITFGSFNDWRKINRSVVRAWAQLLLLVPDSRLILAGFDHVLASARLQRWITEEGVAWSRIELYGRVSPAFLHKLVQRVDLALDSWPYGGGVTSAMVLELGVPLASISGQRAVSRMGASMLQDLGLSELVAESPACFADKIGAVVMREHAMCELRERVVERYRLSIGNATACAESVAELLLRAIRISRN